MLGVALGTEYCGAESAAIYDPNSGPSQLVWFENFAYYTIQLT